MGNIAMNGDTMKPRSVLVVDDDDDMQNILAVGLRQEGHQVTTASTGAEALERLEGQFFDLALLDLKLPDISGVQVLQSIKERNPEAKVVIITGYACLDTAVEALRGGADDYIAKPFRMEELTAIIRKATESPGLPEGLTATEAAGRLATGVPHLDGILNGGIPLYSVNVVSGAPGTGKSILCQQIAFHNASPSSKVLYLSTLSEPLEKLVRYQQEFAFFDKGKLDRTVIYGDIGETILQEGASKTIEALLTRLRETGNIKVVVIDSFKALSESVSTVKEGRALAYNLALQLSKIPCTSFLVGEYTTREMEEEPIFAIADGIFELTNQPRGVGTVRQFRALKLRGGDYAAGLHSFDIDGDGIKLHPRLRAPSVLSDPPDIREKVQTGIEGVDEIFGGGIPGASATLVAGGTGTGKTLLALHFIVQGISEGVPAVLATMQEIPAQLYRIASGFGWDLKEFERQGLLRLLYIPPVELNVDRFAAELQNAIAEIGARRVVIDSALDLETAAASESRYKDYMYSLVSFFKSQGITSLLTSETPDLFGSVRLSDTGVSVVADNVVLLRYVEINSAITRAISVLKARGSDHDKSLKEYKITDHGMKVLGKFEGQTGIMSGSPVSVGERFSEVFSKLR